MQQTTIDKLKEIQKQAAHKMDSSLHSLDTEFNTVRTGRANPALLDKVMAEAYGSPMPINQMANITTPDARTILITPWDKNQVSTIERAIIAANLGFNPNNDGANVRISIPPLTEERRKELVKQASHMAEEARVAIRNVRKHANDEVKKLEKNKDFSEDLGKKAHDDIQKLTDAHIKTVDEKFKKKEQEIMKV